MRIALYHPWVYLRSGLERTIVELTARSRHDWTIFTNHYDPDRTYPELKARRFVELPRVSVDRGYRHVLRSGLRIVQQRLDLSSFDALVISCEGLGDLLTLRNHDRPVFCLCFTPLRAAFDPEYQAHHLRTGAPWRRLVLPLLRWGFAAVDRVLWRRYVHVFCISEEVRKRVLRGRLVPPERVQVVHPGVDLEHWRPTWEVELYFLLPGRIKWTKNVDLAVRAFRRFSRAAPGRFGLVVAGGVDAGSRRYFEGLEALVNGDPSIRFVLDPSDTELLRLYQRCFAVLFPSFNEDWGIVPLEGMACGKPVVAVGRGGPTETVVHGVTGFLTEPTEEDFAAGMIVVAADPARASAMGAAGYQRAQDYSWDTFTKGIDDGLDAHRPRCPKPAPAAR